MRLRARVAVALACVCLLSLPILASGGKATVATASLQVALADILFDHADYRAAMRVYLAAAECDDAAVRERARAGTVRSALRIAEWGIAITQVPGAEGRRGADPATLALAGDALWGVGRFEESEAAYRNTLRLDPANPRGRLGVAKALASRNQLEPALDEALTALGAAPADPEVRQVIGSIYERMHRYDEAASAYLSYLALVGRSGRPDIVQWARTHVAFLRVFEGTIPYEIEPARKVTRHVFDFKLVDGKIVIRGRINGGRTVDLAVDTGSEHTAISEKTASRFGVSPVTETLAAGVGEVGLRGQRLARLRSLELGTLTIYNLPCLVRTPAIEGLMVDSVDAFSPLALGLSMSVDYRARRLTLGELAPDRAPARELPLRLNRLATVEGQVNGSPTSFIVDTGGDGILVSTSTARALLAPAERSRIKLRVFGASGFDPDAYLLPGLDLSFGPLRLPNQSVVVLDLRAPSVLLGYEIGGVIGYRLLGRYRVDFDLGRSVLRLGDL